METKHCNYCGYFGSMPFIHGTYHCPSCTYCLLPGENEDDQDIFDDDYLDYRHYQVLVVKDLLLQQS
ncbi:MAG: hypothetical protein IT244_01205 [Bacteroidia bacterium]|nr:hypothetical protein [Bacteroidia bacterium]